MRGEEGDLRCGVSANEYSCAHGAQISFGDPYLNYVEGPRALLDINCAGMGGCRGFGSLMYFSAIMFIERQFLPEI